MDCIVLLYRLSFSLYEAVSLKKNKNGEGVEIRNVSHGLTQLIPFRTNLLSHSVANGQEYQSFLYDKTLYEEFNLTQGIIKSQQQHNM
jgi:hypothetical protein